MEEDKKEELKTVYTKEPMTALLLMTVNGLSSSMLISTRFALKHPLAAACTSSIPTASCEKSFFFLEEDLT
jgi:hypothetical protein